jgi:hypothetical protein
VHRRGCKGGPRPLGGDERRGLPRATELQHVRSGTDEGHQSQTEAVNEASPITQDMPYRRTKFNDYVDRHPVYGPK